MSDFSLQKGNDGLYLGGELNFYNAGEVLESVSAHIGKSAGDDDGEPAKLTIDLAGVSESNSAGLALMIEWLARAAKAGRAIEFRNVPSPLMELARVSQVSDLIGGT